MHFLNAGDFMPGHTHPFDHTTLVASGSVRVTVDGKDTDFKAPHMIYVQAEKIHKITALEDNTVSFCIHALRDGDGIDDIIDPTTVPLSDNMLIAKGMARPVHNEHLPQIATNFVK
jgi:hypothetical protein